MKKIFKVLMVLLLCNLKCYSQNTFEQTITTTIPAAVNITAFNQALSKGVINPATGNLSSLSASFNIQTNGEDCDYNYIVQAKLNTKTGETNAYFRNSNRDYIILGNVSSSNLPTLNAVNNIKSSTPSSSSNGNAIAYPITNILTNVQSAAMQTSSNYGGLYYNVQMGNSQNGNFVQTLGNVPLTNTYSIADDRAGTYQATVTFSAIRNP